MSQSGLYGVPRHQDPPRSEIWIYNLGNVGSTNAACLYYTKVMRNEGPDMVLTRSSVLGDYITIITPGVYTITMQDVFQQINLIAKNATASEVTAGVGATNQLAQMNYPANGGQISATSLCNAGDVIRPMINVGGLVNTANDAEFFRITRVA